MNKVLRILLAVTLLVFLYTEFVSSSSLCSRFGDV